MKKRTPVRSRPWTTGVLLGGSLAIIAQCEGKLTCKQERSSQFCQSGFSFITFQHRPLDQPIMFHSFPTLGKRGKWEQTLGVSAIMVNKIICGDVVPSGHLEKQMIEILGISSDRVNNLAGRRRWGASAAHAPRD